MHRNTVYGHAEWARHKSSWRHWRHMVSICASGVIGGIGPPVMMSTLSALFVTMVNYGVLRRRFSAWVPELQISITPFNLIAPVLAFLLVFRTNSSYQRFDEARKAWGSNVNRCRDLARQALSWIRAREDELRLDIVLRYIKAYPFYLKHHLTQQPSNSHREFLENGILHQEEVEAIARAPNRPIYVLQVISEIINQCQLPDHERVTMDLNLTQFHDNVGACERIFKTPIPIAYTRLTSRMLILWHLALPYGLWASCKWLTIPATFMSSAVLFYIEQVGVLIEEPFWVLALDSICGGIGGAVDGLRVAHEDSAVMLGNWGARHNADAHHNSSTKESTILEHNNIKKASLEQIIESELDSEPLIKASDDSPRGDHVMVNFDRSKSHHHGPRPAYKDHVNAVFSRLKSMS